MNWRQLAAFTYCYFVTFVAGFFTKFAKKILL